MNYRDQNHNFVAQLPQLFIDRIAQHVDITNLQRSDSAAATSDTGIALS